MKKHVVFYAEDDADDLALMQEAVARLKPRHELVTAIDGQEAVEKLQELKQAGNWPCVIILDGNMPKMNGVETVERIRQAVDPGHTPICIFSTSPTERFSQVAEQYHVNVYRKPTSLKELNATITNLLNHCSR